MPGGHRRRHTFVIHLAGPVDVFTQTIVEVAVAPAFFNLRFVIKLDFRNEQTSKATRIVMQAALFFADFDWQIRLAHAKPARASERCRILRDKCRRRRAGLHYRFRPNTVGRFSNSFGFWRRLRCARLDRGSRFSCQQFGWFFRDGFSCWNFFRCDFDRSRNLGRLDWRRLRLGLGNLCFDLRRVSRFDLGGALDRRFFSCRGFKSLVRPDELKPDLQLIGNLTESRASN